MAEVSPDFSRIQFPSDKVTIAYVRKRSEGMMDQRTVDEMPYNPHYNGLYTRPEYRIGAALGDIKATLYAEREFAELIYKACLDKSNPHRNYDEAIEKATNNLRVEYENICLASGKNAANTLINALKDQVETYASKTRGRSGR